MSRIVITGVTGQGSPNRLEIHDFVKDVRFFSLFIQALQIMEKTPQNDFQSHFQVGGIHGLPFTVWDDAVGSDPVDPDEQWAGYCTHGSVLFPTWHRPYVMLYEQIMQKHAAEVAATYTVDKDSWVAAAANIRQPYWDWAANAIPPDEVIALKQVSITGPNGKKVTVDNPLYHYKFNPIDSSFPSPFSGWPTTLRQPTSSRPNATDNVARLKSVLSSSQADITSSTYNMLTRVRTWPAFSNHTVGDGGSTSNSLEAIHDGIHNDVGGGGQMSDPAVAAFDPIFFLHHANVDRLLSLWSALNPGVWVSANDSEDGTFTLPAGTPVDENTDLTPFWNAQTTFWASDGTQATAALRYTYPEFNGLDLGNPQAVRTAIGNTVNSLYGSSIFGSFAATGPSALSAGAAAATTAAFALPTGNIPPPVAASKPQQPQPHVAADKGGNTRAVPPPPPPPAAAPAPAPAHIPTPPHPHAAPGSLGSQIHSSITHHIVPPNHGLYDWTVRIECKKYELKTSFSVLVFLGSIPENPADWHVSPHFVGAHHAFVNSKAGACANCVSQAEVVVEGFVHLNRAIARHSGLDGLEPEAVVPYLTKELGWRVQKNNGEPAELQSLEVTVTATPLTYPPGALFPVPGTPRKYNGITHGRPGGSRQA